VLGQDLWDKVWANYTYSLNPYNSFMETFVKSVGGSARTTQSKEEGGTYSVGAAGE